MKTNLSESAMLVRLSISQWTARKYDHAVTKRAAEQYHTDMSAGRYNKVLVAKEAIKKITKTANRTRVYHYTNTLPWGDDDFRMLPATNFANYSEKMRELKTAFEAEVDNFITTYPSLVEDAKNKLNGMFNVADYPHQSEIRQRYRFGTAINPLPSFEDFRVSLHDNAVDEIRADLKMRAIESQQRANADLWSRLHTAISHMSDKLSEKDAIFRDSLVQNVVELCELLPRLNVLGDRKLEEMRQEVESRLCSYQPQILRESPIERETAAKEAEDILSAMASYMGG